MSIPFVESLILIIGSGVLAAAIERSRQRWTVDGIFERYWTKPSKKKPIGEASNPAKETMTRLGGCTMIIEPHAFEVTLYTVKDLPPSYQPPPQPIPQYSPYPVNNAYIPPYNPNYSGPQTTQEPQPRNKPSQPSLPAFDVGFGQLGARGAPPVYHGPTHPAPPPEQPHSRRKSTSSHEGSTKNEAGSHADPVIQMLATRAASDHALKALMKVVASSKATPEQLKEFQTHIDELNEILKSGYNPDVPVHDEVFQNPPPARKQSIQPGSQVAIGVRIPPASHPSSVPPSSTPAAPPIKREPGPQPYSMPQPVQPKPVTYKPDIHSIVFDYGGNGDRFTIPRYSILDYLPGNAQVLVSFLVIRRGSTARSGKYKDTKNYYQPVTIRLSTHNPRTLEPLARVVAPLDEVRRYMDSFFDKMAPAESVFLATRLPRSKNIEESEKHDTAVQSEGEVIKSVYAPPDSIVPLAA